MRDILPSRLSQALKQLPFNSKNGMNIADDSSSENINDHGGNRSPGPVFSSVKATLIQSFKATDAELEDDERVESYSSGTTAVAVLKKVYYCWLSYYKIKRSDIISSYDMDRKFGIGYSQY